MPFFLLRPPSPPRGLPTLIDAVSACTCRQDRQERSCGASKRGTRVIIMLRDTGAAEGGSKGRIETR
eukprot:6653309-Pyramimonas_sp.AAC.1